MRAESPVVWLPALDGWLVTTYALAVAVLRDTEGFTVDHPDFTTARVVGPSMLSLDGPDHRRHRVPFLPAHRADAVRGDLERWIETEARRLVEQLASGAELRTAVAGPLAAASVTRFLRLDGVDATEVLQWYRAIVAGVDDLSNGRAPSPATEAAMVELDDAVRRTIRARPESLAGVVAATADLTTAEIVSNVAVIMFGAIETAEGMIANTLWHLLSEPENADAVLADRTLLPHAIEESLRLEPAATRLDRYATRDVELGGASIARDDAVFVSLAAANRDPAMFPHPDEFRLDRANGRSHLAFAIGPHTCIGQPMARIETTAAVTALLDARPAARLDPDQSRPSTGLVFRKPPAMILAD